MFKLPAGQVVVHTSFSAAKVRQLLFTGKRSLRPMMFHSWAARQLGAAIGLLFTELNSWLTDVAGKKMLLIVDRQLEQQAAAQQLLLLF